MSSRFRIRYCEREFSPWELHEWHSTGWYRPGYWTSLAVADTKETLKRKIEEIVAGERKVQTSYYDENGYRDGGVW